MGKYPCDNRILLVGSGVAVRNALTDLELLPIPNDIIVARWWWQRMWAKSAIAKKKFLCVYFCDEAYTPAIRSLLQAAVAAKITIWELFVHNESSPLWMAIQLARAGKPLPEV